MTDDHTLSSSLGDATSAPVDSTPADDATPPPILALEGVGKSYGSIRALSGVSLRIDPASVTCVLGDNGAGKSTLIKILAGRHSHTEGTLSVDGVATEFRGPRQAIDAGIATVYQDLAVVGQMAVWRNFFLGQELTGAFGRLKEAEMRRICQEQLTGMGVDLRDVGVPISSLSGGQRQVVAIARAMYFGARVLILDEPTAALGVKQSGMVLKFIDRARQEGVAVIFITHNPRHAYLVGDRFVVLNLGEQVLDASREEVTVDELTQLMAGGGELDALQHELGGAARE